MKVQADKSLLPYAKNDTQRERLQILIDCDNDFNQAAILAGVTKTPLYEMVQRVQRRKQDFEGVAAQKETVKANIDPDKEVVAKNLKRIEKQLARKVSTYVITWAQNATPVHQGFFDSLQQYIDHTGAILIVIPGRYKNPTSQWTEKNQENEYWSEEVAPYLMDARIQLNDNLIVMGDIKTQPTAVRPLSGLDTITGGKSAVFGHPRLQLVSVATPQNSLPKLLTTTGAVTVENYTDTKSGKKGEFHHMIGAAVVEIDGDKFHMRQINATEDGSFIDLEYEYSPGSVELAERPLALVMGDVHVDFMDPMCEEITFFKHDGIIKSLDPACVVVHDWYDGYSGSHHHKGKVFIKYAKHHSGRDNVEREIQRTFAKTKKWMDGKRDFYIIGSNHNEHLATWLELGEPKNDPENALFYHKLMYLMLEQITMGDSGAVVPNPLQLLAEQDPQLSQLKFLSRDDSLMIHDIDCTHHGDKGSNGSRGSVKQFDTIGVKTITGHGHSPGIEGGAVRVGTNSRLRLEYNAGPSSWFHTDCIIYANGKRALINKVSGAWRAKRKLKSLARVAA